MNSTRRYLPLSLVLVLVCSVSDARANSALDPYAHVKAPSAKEKEKTAIPSVDSITTPSTYVTMPMGNLDEEKKGIVGSMLDSITAPTKTIKNASSGMVSGTKAVGGSFVKGGKMLGDGMAKSASVIGAGIKSSGGKLVDGTQAMGSKIANVVPGRSPSPQKTASNVSELYETRAMQELAKVEGKEVAKQVAESTKDSEDKATKSRRTFLSLDKRSKSRVSDSKPTNSGFYEGALANEAKQKHDEIVGDKKPVNEIATKPLNSPRAKKKWGLGLGKLSTPKIGLGLFKKDAPDSNKAPSSQPANQIATQKQDSQDLKPQAAPAVAAKPAAMPKKEEPRTFVADANPKVEKKSKFGLPPISIGKGLSMPKLRLNPFSKKDKQVNPNPESQTASKKNLQL